MRQIIFWILVVLMSPILIVQGIYTRKKASGLLEPEGERQGIKGQGEKLSLLILGDSAGAGVGVDSQEDALSGQLVHHLAQLKEVRWKLFAKTGDTTQDCLEKLSDIGQEQQFDHVLISLGVNDVTSLVAIDKWLKQSESLLNELETRFKTQHIFWSELPPMGKFIAMPQPLRWVMGQRRDLLSDALESYLKTRTGVRYLQGPDIFADTREKIEDWIAADGFHPGKKTYTLWAKIAAEHILADNQNS